MVVSPFQLINPNMPAASAGQLPDLLGLMGTPPLLNSYTPVQTPLQQMLGTPEPIGSETRPYPLGAFPNDTGDQYVSSTQSTATDSGTDTSSSSSVQAGPNSTDSTGVTPNAAGVDTTSTTATDSTGSADVAGNFYSVKLSTAGLNIIA